MRCLKLQSGSYINLWVSSRWPHHLMPLNCFSASRFLHSLPITACRPPPPPPALSFPLFLSSPCFPHRIPSSASVPHVSPLFYISLLAHFPVFCPSFPLSFAPSFPGEWQAHKCSNDSGGGVSVTAIAAVTGARLSLVANTASASLAPPAVRRDREGDRKREKWLPSPFRPNKIIYKEFFF